MKDIYDTLREWKKSRGSDGHSGSEFALVNAHSRERIKLSLAGRTHVDCQDGRRVGSLNAGIHTTLECTNMPALLKQ
jgi:hypothetical protein